MENETMDSAKALVVDCSDLRKENASIDTLYDRYVKQIAESDKSTVVFDMTSLDKIYSFEVALLVKLYKKCENGKCQFQVIVSNKKVYSILKLLKLTKIFRVLIADK
ncbi:MAG: STAS domain-containing protein [Fibrobacterota bacterium]